MKGKLRSTTGDPVSQKSDDAGSTNYAVGISDSRDVKGPPAIDGPPSHRKVAVFVAHGMGQQIPFQTLDQVAEGLRRRDVDNAHQNGKPIARTLKSGDQWLRRIELQLKRDDDAVEAHVYEAYWAPLTEGKISARGVIKFLAGAGNNGLKNSGGQFKRWLFDEYTEYPTPIRTVLYLLVALASVAALVEMNSAIAVVAAGRALLAQKPAWLTDGLFADLTTAFNAVVSTMALFAVFLGGAMAARKAGLPKVIRRIWSWLTVVAFAATVSIVILAGIAIAALFYGHVRGGAGPDARLWYGIFSQHAVDAFNRGFDWSAWHLTLVGIGMVAGWWIIKIGIGVFRDFRAPPGRWLTLLVVAAFLILVAATIWMIAAFLEALKQVNGGKAADVVAGGLAWPLLIAASAYIRTVLIQYLGDVAIYVTAHTLDAFNDVRKEIKSYVHAVAEAVYSAAEYERVIVVGHSLGSVIIYDALNQLINEDESNANSMKIVERTHLLLTFGSPLDKTAFIFGMQANHTTEAREALAASGQPLIRAYNYRPKQWVNIYSPWDIISGSLGLYDSRDVNDARRVQNIADPDATTLLVAHTEYWGNPLVFETIYQAL